MPGGWDVEPRLPLPTLRKALPAYFIGDPTVQAEGRASSVGGDVERLGRTDTRTVREGY
jgi:hypothetical protein